MPRNIVGTFETDRARWTIMVDGKRYRVKCKDLGLPKEKWTKLDSWKEARSWADSIVAPSEAVRPNHNVIEELETRLDLAHRLGLTSEISEIAASLAHIKKLKEPLSPDERKLALGLRIRLDDGTERDDKVKFFAWKYRKSQANAVIKKTNQTRTNLDEFFEISKARQKPATHIELKRTLNNLLDVGVLPQDASTIAESTVTANYKHLQTSSWKSETKNKRLGFFRRFIAYLVEIDVLEKTPKNLKSKLHRFRIPKKSIKTYDNVKAMIERLPAKLKLWALLGLNCGMTQADLGALTWEMIDLKKKTLTRKRVKTEQHDDVPTVTYWLFPETVDGLLKTSYRKGLVFRTRDNQPMHTTIYKGEGVAVQDLFSTYWKRCKPKPEINLGKFRHVGATALKTNILYRGLVDYYLGHAGSTLADSVYSAEADNPFFQALKHVRSRLGFGKEKKSSTSKSRLN